MDMRFQKIAGSFQIILKDAKDLRQVQELDPALWAVTALPVDTLVIDERFLHFLDDDKNGRITPKDILQALDWLFKVVRDDTGITEGSSILKLDSINTEDPEGEAIHAAGRRILNNLCLTCGELTLDQIMEKKNIISDPLSNGDGVIPPDAVKQPELSQFIRNVIGVCGSVLDVTGIPGINGEILTKFREELESNQAWFSREKSEPELSPFGNRTENIYAVWEKLHEKLDEFFRLCSAISGVGQERLDSTMKIDPMDIAAAEAFLKKAPAAEVNPEKVLKLNGWINPIWREEIQKLFDPVHGPDFLKGKDQLTEKAWLQLNAKMLLRAKWIDEKPNNLDEKIPRETISKYVKGKYADRTQILIDSNLKTAREISAHDGLQKLILFQKHILEFTNNCISLSSLFDPEKYSIAQPGHLIMDGRHFTLITKVSNLAEHKKIISRSRICVMYVELSAGIGTAQKKMTIACAVTSGTMRNIFTGKTGIFIGEDGEEWFAKVIDFVQQPVSFTEALTMPFYKIGEFAGKQADRFFSARSKALETDITKTVDKTAMEKMPQKIQTPAVSGSMMLMGGGLGIAALGSAFAFIANTLKNTSVWNVLAVLIGIVLVISIPMIVVSLTKLWNRSISDFYSAGDWAVNPKMKLSCKMGSIFTTTPTIPLKALIGSCDLINAISVKYKVHKNKRHFRLFFLLLVLAISAALACFLFLYRKPVPERPKTVPVQTEKKAPAPNKPVNKPNIHQ